MKKIKIILLFSLIFALLIPAQVFASWTIETKDSDNCVGSEVDLTIDSNGNPHFAYYDVTNNALIYLGPEGREVVVQDVKLSQVNPKIAVGSDGIIHIVFYDHREGHYMTPGHFSYVQKNASGWLPIEEIITQDDVESQTERLSHTIKKYYGIIIKDDLPYIYYPSWDSENGHRTKLAIRTAVDTFEKQIIQINLSEDKSVSYAKLAIDSSGATHFLVRGKNADNQNAIIYLSELEGDYWQTEVIQVGSLVPMNFIFASDKTAYGVFYENIGVNEKTFYLAKKPSGDDWSVEEVISGDFGDPFISLAVSDDLIYIVYMKLPEGQLECLSRYRNYGSWQNAIIDDSSVTGAFCSASVDSNGQAHIAYYDLTDFNLKYANGDAIDDIAPVAFNLSSPVNNFSTSNSSQTFLWNASSDAYSSFSHYQLYIDGSLDTNNISGTSTTPTNSLFCGNHTWHVKAVDNAGLSTNSNTFNLTIVCGGGIPVWMLNQINNANKTDGAEENNNGGEEDSHLRGNDNNDGNDNAGSGNNGVDENGKNNNFAYDRSRLKSLAQEKNSAKELKQKLEEFFGKGKIPVHRKYWHTIVNPYIYGNYPIKAIIQAIKFKGKTVHPIIPFSVWKTAKDYLEWIKR